MVWPAWVIATIVSTALNVAAYILTPKPKQPRPPAVQEPQAPTASAGRPIPVIWGSVMIKGPNVLWYGELQARQYEVKV